MPKYLFSNDLRISSLPERIKWVANYVQSGQDLKDIERKSDNNNAATLEFYFNLYKDSETCILAQSDSKSVIRNFVKKFQYPNTRTLESLDSNITERIFLAPYRTVISILLSMAHDNDSSYLTFEEILYYIFCNDKVYSNPLVNYDILGKEIISNRNIDQNLADKIEGRLDWKQYHRQIREMMTILNYATESFKCSNGNVLYNLKSGEQDFISEIINYKIIWYPSNISDYNLSCKEYISYLDMTNTPYNVIDFSKNSNVDSNISESVKKTNYRQFLTAIKSKPFLLLAGISGTGKSRIVRELARACWEEGSEEFRSQKPENFEMLQVKPNWHDSSELIGYVSRVSGKAIYVVGDFLRFIAKAWEDIKTPYFLCLDEMNLAPVEQYFAEYLSVIESRKLQEDGIIKTDPILEKSKEDWYRVLTSDLAGGNGFLRDKFLEDGICIPQNLIVVGTVNMDETTFSFSRKVLDRAMTIEMNNVDLRSGLDSKYEHIGKLSSTELLADAVEGVDVYASYKVVCDIILDYLQAVNEKLEGTPFKIAYRTRNEFLLYVVNNLPYNKDENDQELSESKIIARALDEITSMKILSRIEGDETKVSNVLLDSLSDTISNELKRVLDNETLEYSISLAKLKEMKECLNSGYTSFWS